MSDKNSTNILERHGVIYRFDKNSTNILERDKPLRSPLKHERVYRLG